MEIYLDNAATTRVCTEAADIAYKVMTDCYGNPSLRLGERRLGDNKRRGKRRKTRQTHHLLRR